MSISNKEKYRVWCDTKSVPLFMQAWWMDAVCFGNKEWDVFLVERKGVITAAMPIHQLKKFGFRVILQPEFTQYNGLWIDYPNNCTREEKYILEEEIISNFITQLEQIKPAYYQQNFHFSFTNWQTFYAKGFSQTTRYTYLIEDISDLKAVFDNFNYAKQKHIKKSQLQLDADFSLSAEDFYNFHKRTLQQRGQRIAYSSELFQRIYTAAVSREQGAIISVKDKNKNLHAALFVVWDKNSAYNLISAIDLEYKASGASTLVVWEIIQYLSGKTRIFDFEGSMIESVAKSFRQFGTVRKSYFAISKSYSKCVSFLIKLKKNGIS
jgi:hypothetical protein